MAWTTEAAAAASIAFRTDAKRPCSPGGRIALSLRGNSALGGGYEEYNALMNSWWDCERELQDDAVTVGVPGYQASEITQVWGDIFGECEPVAVELRDRPHMGGYLGM